MFVIEFFFFFLIYAVFLTVFFFCSLDGFTNKYTAIPSQNLVNQLDLNKILKVKVFVYKDRQLRSAHLTLSYNSLSSSFQVPKCVIRGIDKCLHLINIAVPDFLNLDLALEGVQQIELPFYFATEEEATPSQPIIKEEAEVAEVSDFEDDFKVVNQPQSPEALTEDFSSLPLGQVRQTQEHPTIPNTMVL